MTAAKRRAKAGRPGGKGSVKNRPAGKSIMKTQYGRFGESYNDLIGYQTKEHNLKITKRR